MLKLIYDVSKSSWFLFQKKRGTTLASSSTFYIILTMVPFFLLIIRVIGMLLGDMQSTEVQIFELAGKFLPDVAPQMLKGLQGVVSGPLFAKGQFTLLNFAILLVSSLSFFNSIWNGLFLITDDKSYLSISKHIKGILVIGVTILFLTILFFIPSLIFYVSKLMSNNMLVDFLTEHFPQLLFKLRHFSPSVVEFSFVMKSNFFHFFIFSLFFTFLYRWFYSWKLSLKQALVGSLTFSSLLILGKNLFWIYFMYIRSTLMRNYGDYYTVIVIIIWLYLAMSFFYFGACVCTTLVKKNLLTKKVVA
ncbi:YihY/virulence factor BrkB family protein [Halobacteriovorax sp. HLS]|uniref:YihY/virulence factor BrkB family protein n=1 Tax=Halobacteriovorax sp. HLS TaxID=2234000 RepID=UPI000FD863FA|nr:YhjD/YihY/BrkB family envelope integrity protein [Halobacteriovorax sp. HLS]